MTGPPLGNNEISWKQEKSNKLMIKILRTIQTERKKYKMTGPLESVSHQNFAKKIYQIIKKNN